jgi:lysyl-tRNA synthetase class II
MSGHQPIVIMTLSEIARWWGKLDPGEDSGDTVTVEGRLVFAHQEAEKLAFWMLNDGNAEVQLWLARAELGDDRYAAVYEATRSAKRSWQVRATGMVQRTRRGVLTVRARTVEFHEVEGAHEAPADSVQARQEAGRLTASPVLPTSERQEGAS